MPKILFTRRFEGDDVDQWKEAAKKSKAKDLTQWIERILNRAAKPKKPAPNDNSSHPTGRRFTC